MYAIKVSPLTTFVFTCFLLFGYDESIFSFTTNFIRASIKFHSQRNIETTSFDDIVGSVKSKVTTKDIISKLNLSERTIYRELATLKQLNRIRRVGSDKTGYWESVPQN